ncbi:MAG: site-2 protease family protein [Thermoplasmata archaeon]
MTWTPTPSASYWVGPPPRRAGRITTSRTELLHLVIAFVVLSVDFAILRTQFTVGTGFSILSLNGLVDGLLFGATAGITGFVAHEMAHKVAAQRYGFWAEFRLSPTGLLLSLVTSLFGFLFAAPGATVVDGMGDLREWGRTSLAGPAVNLVEAGAFLGAAFGGALAFQSFAIWSFMLLLTFFNAWFATFNLIPFGLLDGQKVWRWNKAVWAGAFVLSAAFTILVFVTLTSPMPTG